MYYPSSENKGADQLRGYREADLRLCFRLCRLLVFPWGGSDINQNTIHTFEFSNYFKNIFLNEIYMHLSRACSIELHFYARFKNQVNRKQILHHTNTRKIKNTVVNTLTNALRK